MIVQKKQMKVWLAAVDCKDGSQAGYFYNTKEEALESLDRTEEELNKGTFYDDGAIKEITINVLDSDGVLTLEKDFGFDTDTMN